MRFLLLVTIYLILPKSNLSAQDSAEALYDKAYRYLSVDKAKAIELLSQTIEADSTHADAHFHRGITYFKLGQFDSALSDFKVAYDLKPNNTLLLMYQGFAYRNLGDIQKAMQSFSKYISLNPTDTSAYSYVLRGKMKYELGDFDGAVADYDLASKLRPYREKYNYYKFVAYRDAGNLDKALQTASNLINSNPDLYGYYFYKGQLFQELQQYDSAVFMYNIAVIKNYQNADSYYYRGQSYQRLNEHEKALEDLNTAIELNEKEGAYYSSRGNIKQHLGNLSGACADWNEAGRLGYYEDFDKIKEVCN